jgi:fatty-acyl-CoA synthase
MAGAPCPPSLVRRVIEELDCPDLRIGYGQTESSPLTHLTRAGDTLDTLDTVGTNLPHQETKVIDPETGATVPRGTTGEVCFRGYHVMRGYFEDPDATAAAVDEAGWLHSGDLGVLDDEDRLRITGRRRDLVIRGGENIYPAVVEACYAEHPQVAEVAVFGVPDEKYGEQLGAWVKLRAGEATEPGALKAYAAERLARHEVPEYVWLVDELPRTSTGKVQKFRIRQTVTDWLTATPSWIQRRLRKRWRRDPTGSPSLTSSVR